VADQARALFGQIIVGRKEALKHGDVADWAADLWLFKVNGVRKGKPICLPFRLGCSGEEMGRQS